jgi:hypothetical protein
MAPIKRQSARGSTRAPPRGIFLCCAPCRHNIG